MNEETIKQTKEKIDQINKSNPTKLLAEVVSIVKKLNNHIDEIITLDQIEIETLCKSLTRFTILPAIPLSKGTWVGRARKIKDGEAYYTNTNKLSYNPDPSKVSLQRMNKKGQSLFYCSFGGEITPNKMVSTILSEVNAEAKESFYMLASKLTDTIYCAPIGIFDYYRRGVPDPFRLHSSIEELYNFYKKYTEKDGMLAIELCDAFLTNVLKKENNRNNRVYQVTSEIANDCFNSGMDGLLYPSVKFEDYPNLVIKTDVIDNKFVHEWVDEYEVIQKLDYNIYDFKYKGQGSVLPNTNGYIAWPSEVYALGNNETVCYSTGGKEFYGFDSILVQK